MVVGVFGKKRILAIIPARGGSKRIPKKNIIPLAGKPMIQWTIEAAKSCDYIDRIVVSTDSEEIRQVALNSGLDIPFLREFAADDVAPVSEATLACLEQSEAEWGSYDIIIQLMANCPLRTSEVITQGIEKYFLNNEQPQISYFKYGWMNPWWAHTVDKYDHPHPIFPDAIKSRSQDLEELYCPTGSIWIINAKDLKKYKTFYSPGYKSFVIDWLSALDIDDEDDLKMAQAAFKLKGI